MNSDLEVIDAFVDGERVSPEALKSALSESAGRDYFVDVWALRDVVQKDVGSLSAAPQKDSRRDVRRPRTWLAAAALVVGVAGGYVAGARGPRSIESTSAPAPTAAVTATATPPGAPLRGVFPAPQPTRIIQLEFHPDTTRSGGN